jgi:hypothetical protein
MVYHGHCPSRPWRRGLRGYIHWTKPPPTDAEIRATGLNALIAVALIIELARVAEWDARHRQCDSYTLWDHPLLDRVWQLGHWILWHFLRLPVMAMTIIQDCMFTMSRLILSSPPDWAWVKELGWALMSEPLSFLHGLSFWITEVLYTVDTLMFVVVGY